MKLTRICGTGMRTMVVVGLLLALVFTLLSSSCFKKKKDDEAVVTVGSSAAPLFAGSASCESCHAAIYLNWKNTRHNKKVRTPSETPGVVADSNNDGTDDFKDGRTLGNPTNDPDNDTDWLAYFTAGTAPQLGYTNGTYWVKVGNVTYNVSYTLGGTGKWKQRYMTTIGSSLYILPIQYNDVENEWTTYDPDHWYNTVTWVPVYAAGETPVSKGNQANSWERRCFGCHTTGVTAIALNSANEYVVTYTDRNVGCEACHGDGTNHIALGGGLGTIINPADLTRDRANEVCGRCHARGTSKYSLGGNKFDYTWSSANQPFTPGDLLSDFYDFTTLSSKYWGYGLRLPDGADFIAPQSHHQQLLDMNNSVHASVGSMTCFTCHDAHGDANSGQILTSIIVNKGSANQMTIQTKNEDNTLCLACHAEKGVFASITKQMVADISEGFVAATVATTINDHMSLEAGMAGVSYDPVGTEVGRCSSCHMPKTGKSAFWDDDEADNDLGDIRSHTGKIVWPTVNRQLAPTLTMTTSCTQCHADDDPYFAETWQWSISGHSASTSMAFWYPVGPSHDECIMCHSGEGFVDTVEGAAIVSTDPKMHSCGVCHEPTGSDDHAIRVATPLDPVYLPSGRAITGAGNSRVCFYCHTGRKAPSAYVDEDYPHYGLGASMFIGTDADPVINTGETAVEYGIQFGSQTPIANSAHTITVTNSCVECHMAAPTPTQTANIGGHTFKMTSLDATAAVSGCNVCHSAVISFNQVISDYFVAYTANGDFDGDGMAEGVQDEVQGLLDRVMDAISNSGLTKVGRSWSGYSVNPVILDAQKKALFNWTFVDHDDSLGIHNTNYAVQILQRTWTDLEDATDDGVMDYDVNYFAVAYPLAEIR